MKKKIIPSVVAVAIMGGGVVMSANSNAASEQIEDIYTTGYSYYDNTPAGSADISNPIIHKKAGGTGTFNDPITVAVGHTKSKGKDTLDYPEGTKMYIPSLHKYFIVEDTCGDGATPQNGPCHTGYTQSGKKYSWIDLWVGGSTVGKTKSDACMDKITDIHKVIINPVNNYVVNSGAVSDSGCNSYSDTPVKISGTTSSIKLANDALSITRNHIHTHDVLANDTASTNATLNKNSLKLVNSNGLELTKINFGNVEVSVRDGKLFTSVWTSAVYGNHAFTYTVTDSNGQKAKATYTVNVTK